MDILKAAGEVGTKWMTDVCNSVARDDDKIPEDCSKSWLLNVYKGKEDPLTCDSCHKVAETSYENVGKSH